MHRLPRLVAVALALGSFAGSGSARAGDPPVATSAEPTTGHGTVRVHVRGSAQLQVVAIPDGDGFTVRGELDDDVGLPIARLELTIDAISKDGDRAPLPVPSACAGSARVRGSVKAIGREEYRVETDEHGAFCVRGGGPIAASELRVRFAGDTLRDAAQAVASLDAEAAHLARAILRFEPSPEAVDLDRDVALVGASLRVERDPGKSGPDAALKREGLTLVLEDERGSELARAVTSGDGRVRFELPTAKLDGPGEGELRVRFEGSSALAKAVTSQRVVRKAGTKLAAPPHADTGDPEEGVEIDVDVTSSRGPVSGGVVEALLGGESVGAGSVEMGRARVFAAFARTRAQTVPLSLRYVPAAPWWRVGPEVTVEVRLATASSWRLGVLGAIVLAIAGWIVAGWRRAPKHVTADGEASLVSPPSGRAGVQIMRTEPGITGWRGVVADAHDGTPVPGAVLQIHVPAFEGDGILASTTADDGGAFSLDAPGVRSDARLVVQSEDHSRYEQALPPPSIISVALVTRRRTLVDRLVRWARRQGSPFDGPAEPTPGHVRRVAARSSAGSVESWAGAVEQAAFGPAAVDEKVEQAVRALEPRGQ